MHLVEASISRSIRLHGLSSPAETDTGGRPEPIMGVVDPPCGRPNGTIGPGTTPTDAATRHHRMTPSRTVVESNPVVVGGPTLRSGCTLAGKSIELVPLRSRTAVGNDGDG